MPRGGRRHRNRPKDPQSMKEFHEQLSVRFVQMTLCNGVSLYSGMITNNSGEGCSLLFIIPEVKEILRTGSTFSFNCNVVHGPSFGNVFQKLYVIMGMHKNAAFVIGFALMSESTKCAFQALYYKILSIEPRWRPITIISSYNIEEAEAIKTVFPNTKIQGCWFYNCKNVWKQLDSLALGFFCNTNRIAYEHMHMWTALPLLPTVHTINGFIELKAHLVRSLQSVMCSEYCRKFNSFFNMYKALWFEGVRREIFPMRNAEVLRSNIEIELCSQHLQANIEFRNNPAPWPFIRSLIAYSKFAIINYQKSNEGNYEALEQPRRIWNRHVETYKRSLKHFYEGRSTILQYLVDMMCITPGYVSPMSNAPQSIPWNLLAITETNHNDDDESLLFVESDSSNDEDVSSNRVIPEAPPPLIPFLYAELAVKPLIAETCCICLSSRPKIIASPCMHQCMCVACYERSRRVRPSRHRPFYRCALCRRQIDLYISLK